MCVLVVVAASVSPATAVIGDPQRVSLDAAGGDRSGVALGSAVSADGRWVAFTSADDLTGTPAAGVLQLYVRNRVSGQTMLASSTAAGDAADGPVDDPTDHRAYAVSADGRYVVFATGAANLVTGDSDGSDRDVFRKDLRTGALMLVSRTTAGAAANGPVAGDPDISFDGSRVVYETGGAANLWAGDTLAGASDIVVSDLVAGTSALASADATGAALTGTIRRPALSADGRVVAFEDDAVITVRDLGAASTMVGPAGVFPDLSGDGRVLVFQSLAGAILRSAPVTATPTQVAANGAMPGVSADGARVAFETVAALVAGDVNGKLDVYARHLAGAVERVSQGGDGSQVDRNSDRPAISADGGVVVFGLNDGALPPPRQSLPLQKQLGPARAVRWW